jgi:hypothetical protein
MDFKWAGVLVAVVTIALDALANLLLATLTPHMVPNVVNLFAMSVASVAAVLAVIAHLHAQTDAKLDLVIELLVGRFEEMEARIGDRNSGFVEGYMLSRSPDAAVVPLTPRGRRTVNLDD